MASGKLIVWLLVGIGGSIFLLSLYLYIEATIESRAERREKIREEQSLKDHKLQKVSTEKERKL